MTLTQIVPTLDLTLPSVDPAQVSDLTDQLTPIQWAGLGLLALLLVIAIANKLAKTAIVLAILVGLGGLAVYGNSEGWFT